MNLPRICFVTTVSITLKSFVLNTAKYLNENGNFEITFICDDDDAFAKELPNYIKYIPVPMERGISISGIKAAYKLYSIFKKEKFDIIQYSTPNASCYASIAAKIANVPVRLYCQWGIVYVGFFGVKRKVLKIIEKMICSFSTWIEPDSFGNLRFSHDEGLYTKTKSSVIWNGSASGVDLKKFDISQKNMWRTQTRGKYGLDEAAFVFGFVGRLDKDKGVNELLAAFRNILAEKANVYLMMIGGEDKPDTINETLYQWSKQENHVIYCGRTNEVEKYLSAMDIFLLPSYREGFGSVVIEAEAMGVPVIVSDIPGPTDAMAINQTGLVVKKADVEALESAMRLLMSDKEKLKFMGLQGISYAKENFNCALLMEHIFIDRVSLVNKQKEAR